MTKHPAEVFGHSVGDKSPEAGKDRKRYWCLFVDEKCNKQSRLIEYPFGVCSVQYGSQVVALSPRRFLQDHTVFKCIADHYFGQRNDLLVFREVGLSGIGNFDFVMVKHKQMSSEIEDFVIIEFQTGQTTSTGKLVQGLKDLMAGDNIRGRSYGFGLNLADIWKRTFTQILNKGIVLEQWAHKIYWVVQEPVYCDFLDRYNLQGMTYDPGHKTIFMIFDLKKKKNQYALIRTRVESSTIDTLFKAFRHNPHIPSKDEFTKKLEGKIKANLQLQLQLD